MKVREKWFLFLAFRFINLILPFKTRTTLKFLETTTVHEDFDDENTSEGKAFTQTATIEDVNFLTFHIFKAIHSSIFSK